MSNVVRAVRTRVLLDNFATGDERWASLIGCQMIHPRFGQGTIQSVKAERFRDPIFGVLWSSGQTTSVSSASFINGMIQRVIVPEGIGIPVPLSKWVRVEESDQARKLRLEAAKAEETPGRRPGRATRNQTA
jgi:hypothetical protein